MDSFFSYDNDYIPLFRGPNSFRLLQIVPPQDPCSTILIECHLYNYSDEDGQIIPAYTALSYVWGDPRNQKTISLNGKAFDVTENLYAVLFQLRAWDVALVWIDAICINQRDIRERGHQVRLMSNIYSNASRVIVWLGEEDEHTKTAFEAIREQKFLCGERSRGAVLELLKRRWFRRIWVLQEVAAAKDVLVTCGIQRIDGYEFCLGLKTLQDSYNVSPESYNRIRAITSLIRRAYLTPTDAIAHYKSNTLKFRPLNQLLDMYHTHEATEKHDKVYALLGMRSDKLRAEELEPDYGIPWGRLFEQVVQLFLTDSAKVTTQNDSEIATVESRVRFFGEVVSVTRSGGWGDEQTLSVASKNTSSYFGGIHKWTISMTLHASAKPVLPGDLLCMLDGVAIPTILRRIPGRLSVIVIDASSRISGIPDSFYGQHYFGRREITNHKQGLLLDNLMWRTIVESSNTFPRELTIIWDWSSGIPLVKEGKKPFSLGELSALNASRCENMGLLLASLGKNSAAEDMFKEAGKSLRLLEELREVNSGSGMVQVVGPGCIPSSETSNATSIPYLEISHEDPIMGCVVEMCLALERMGFFHKARVLYEDALHITKDRRNISRAEEKEGQTLLEELREDEKKVERKQGLASFRSVLGDLKHCVHRKKGS